MAIRPIEEILTPVQSDGGEFHNLFLIRIALDRNIS